jgi:hypothetical protein
MVRTAGSARAFHVAERLYHHLEGARDRRTRSTFFADADLTSDAHRIAFASPQDFARSRVLAREVFGAFADDVPELRSWFAKNHRILRSRRPRSWSCVSC